MPKLKRGSKGFTLLELMVVMAIMAVLAAIVMPAVSGTKATSTDAQVKNDAGVVQSALSDYFGDQEGAEVLTPSTATILGTNTVNEETSSKWPEMELTETYSIEFPTAAAAASGDVEAVVVTDDTGATIALTDLAANYTALDVAALATGDYIPEVPNSVTSLTDTFHNYLWLLQKTEAAGADGAPVASRAVAVFKLAKVQIGSATNAYKTLTYEQIF